MGKSTKMRYDHVQLLFGHNWRVYLHHRCSWDTASIELLESMTRSNEPMLNLYVGDAKKIIIWLVVEPTPLKHMKVNWDDYSQYMEK